jgi:hypothetical protein
MLALPSRLALFSVALVIVAISGAALVWDGPAAPSQSASSVLAEYRSEASHLLLAPGWRWSDRPPIGAGTPETQVHYPKGLGTRLAESLWFCSWATRAVSATQSSQARRDALAQLSAKLHDPAFAKDFPMSIVARALRGDTQELRDNASTCGTPEAWRRNSNE